MFDDGKWNWLWRLNGHTKCCSVMGLSFPITVGLHWNFIITKFTSRCSIFIYLFLSVFDKAESVFTPPTPTPPPPAWERRTYEKDGNALKPAFIKSLLNNCIFKVSNWMFVIWKERRAPRMCFLGSWHAC